MAGYRGTERFTWCEGGAAQGFALVGAVVPRVESYWPGSGEIGEPGFVGFGGHDDVHAWFGPYRVGGLRSGLEERVDEGVGPSLRFGSTEMGHVRILTMFGARGFPVGQPFHRNETFEQFLNESALRRAEAAVKGEPCIELFKDTYITEFVQGVVSLTDTFGVSKVQPVFHDVGELGGVEPSFVLKEHGFGFGEEMPASRVPERFGHETNLLASKVTDPIAASRFVQAAEHFGESGAPVRFGACGATCVRAPRFGGSMFVANVQFVTVNDIDQGDGDGVEFAAGLFDPAGPFGCFGSG